jgi:uncharacterized membrane protein
MQIHGFVIFTVVVLTSASLLAQVPTQHYFVFFSHDGAMAGTDPTQVSDDLFEKVRVTLSLSDAQVNGLKALLAIRLQATSQLHQEALENRRKLADLSKQSNPNSTELGNAFLAARSVEEQLRAVHEKFRTDFKAMLSMEQRLTLQKLEAASEQIGSLAAVGVVAGSSEGTFVMPASAPPGAFAIGIHRQLSKDR